LKTTLGGVESFLKVRRYDIPGILYRLTCISCVFLNNGQSIDELTWQYLLLFRQCLEGILPSSTSRLTRSS
jgi:hypothetical protein